VLIEWHYLEGDKRQCMAMQLMSQLKEMADALWEGHTLLKTGLSAHRHIHTHTHRQTDRQTDRSENSISTSFTPFTWRI